MSARLRSGLEAASAPAFKLTFAALLILAALGTTYTGSEENFPEFELPGVLVRGMVVSGILLPGALAVGLRSKAGANAALALVTLVGVFTAYVVHTEMFHPANRVWMIFALAAVGFTLFAAFRAIDNARWAGLALSAAASLPILEFVRSRVWPMIAPGISTPGGLLYLGNPLMWAGLIAVCAVGVVALYLMFKAADPSRWGAFAILAVLLFVAGSLFWLYRHYDQSGDGYYAAGWEAHPNVRGVTFKETPNIYFVGFDAITPEAIMRKHMGIETTDFHRAMERDMRRFSNLFANSVGTTYFYRTLMALDLDILLEHREATGSSPNYFAGHDLSPLVWIMRENGYETTSIYQDTFFGYEPGPGIDHYIIRRKGAVCSLLDRDIRPWGFWGYCWNHIEESGRTEGSGLTNGGFLVRELAGIDRDSPQFVIAHLYLPGHTSKMFDYDSRDARERFLESYERNFNSAAIYLEQIIDHLKANDPDGILFVYGDHGALLSVGVQVEDNPEFVLQDWFGILGGVYPSDRCGSEFDAAESKGYVTTLDVVHAILECLSGGQSPLEIPRRDRFWTYHLPEDHAYEYEEFLYE